MFANVIKGAKAAAKGGEGADPSQKLEENQLQIPIEAASATGGNQFRRAMGYATFYLGADEKQSMAPRREQEREEEARAKKLDQKLQK